MLVQVLVVPIFVFTNPIGTSRLEILMLHKMMFQGHFVNGINLFIFLK